MAATLDVLQVVTDTDRRGGQTFAADLHPALERCGLRVRTVALVPGTNSTGLDLEMLGTSRRSPALYTELARAMRGASVSVAHGSSTLVSCAASGLVAERPFIYRQISDVRFWSHTAARRARVTTYLRRPRLIVALSRHDRTALLEHLHVDPSRVRIVPNGVPRERVRALADRDSAERRTEGNALTFCYVGALVAEKGVHVAIDALSLVPGARLLVAGSGPERARLEALAAERTPGRVEFLGVVSPVTDVLARSDVIVLASLSESFPAVLIEAGMCGLPSITSAVGGVPEIVQHGRTGLLVPPEDPVALAAAMQHLSSADVFRARLGREARRHFEQYEIHSVARQWQAVIEEALVPEGNSRSSSGQAA